MFKNLKIQYKLLLLLAIPVISLLIFTITIIIEKATLVNETNILQKISDIAVNNSLLVHEIQKERGLSAGFLGSNGKRFASDLQIQKSKTNKQLAKFKNFLNDSNIEQFDIELGSHISEVLEELDSIKLESKRNAVTSLNITVEKIIEYYSEINDLLIEINTHVIVFSTNPEISRLILTSVMLSQIKENAGLERAILSTVFSRNMFDKKMFNDFISLIATKKSYLNLFHHFASSKQKQFYNKTMQRPVINEVDRMKEIALGEKLKTGLINNLHIHGGYGGLIHHFKNYVLRGDKKYIDDFNDQYKRITNIFNEYKKIVSGLKKNVKNIKIIQNTFDKYKKNLSLAIKLKKMKKSIKEIDSIVKIDDTPALKAFSKLMNASHFGVKPEYWWKIATNRINLLQKVEIKISNDLKNKAEELKNEAQSTLMSYSAIITTILFITFFLSYLITRVITNPLKTAVKLSNQLAAGDRTAKIEIISKDETGQMLSAMQNMAAAINIFEKTLEDERENLAIILTSIGDGVIATDIEGHITLINPAAQKLTGFTQKFAIGKSIDHIVHIIDGDTRNRYLNLFEFVLKQDTAVKYNEDALLISKDETEKMIAFTETVIRDKNNYINGLVLAFQDITERSQMKSKLLQTYKELADIKFALDEHSIVVITDPNGVITYANDKLCEVSQYSKEELIGNTYKIVNSNYHSKEFWKNLWDTLIRGKSWKGEIRNKAKDGSFYWLDSTIVPFLDENGKPYQYVSIRTDITKSKQASEALLKAKKFAEETSRIKSEFMANMSHEIRTPMNGIIGMTELALATNLNFEQREYLEIVRLSADYLLTVLNDILDFSKIEEGKLELFLIDFNLNDVLHDIIKTFSIQTPMKQIELIYHISPDLPDALNGDPTRLKQIIVNLVDNAIKFTNKGEIVLQVTKESDHPIEKGEKQITLHFSVSDTGIGILPEKQNLIFEAFRQADGSSTRMYSGIGLGLTISKHIIEMMNGRIWLESKVDKGSTFHFTARFGLQEISKLKKPSIVSVKLSNLPVLVVDDLKTNQRIHKELLTHWKMIPTVVSNDKAALTLLEMAQTENEPFQLALIDLNMSNMDGFKLSQIIKDNPKLKETKIILLTSGSRSEDAERCEKIGVSAYLTKPVKQSELLNTIVTVLDQSQKEKQMVTDYSSPQGLIQRHILLVEDNIMDQKLAQYILENWGHQVVAVKNGKQALTELENDNFDLILMDIKMPGIDGYEATTIIREKEKKMGGHIPIIALSSYVMKKDKELCLEAGMDDYISKPIQANELFDVIERFAPLSATPILTDHKIQADNSEVIDSKKALKRMGGDKKLFGEIAKLFLEHSPEVLLDIQNAITQKDAKALDQAAHSLKGSISAFDAHAAFETAKKLEIMGKKNDMTHAQETLTQLQEEYEQVKLALANIVKNEAL